jgi:DNA-binding beta-propeller fold protein YncE
VIGRTPTPAMPHGIYPSRDGRFLYVSDRMAGEVSVYSLTRHRIVDTWKAPPGGTPDMGGVSADGKMLWLSGRDTGYVYGWDTHSGKLVSNIHVGGNPHGLLVWPQPGRYSLGHTGNLR